MNYVRKTVDRWDIEVNYGYGDGWETECSEYTLKEAKANLKAYRENVQAYGKGIVRMVKRREKKTSK